MSAFAVVTICLSPICGVAGGSIVAFSDMPPRGPAVVSVALSPRAITVDIGEVYQFSAIARLSDGSVAGLASFHYSTTAGEITASGEFTAPRSAGTVHVMVIEHSGKADTATVTVVVPTEPYFTDNFDSCALHKTGNPMGFKWRDSQGHKGELPVVSDAIAHSGTCSLKFTFGAGPAGDDAWSEQRFGLGKKLSEVYLQWYQYFPSGHEEPWVGPRYAHRNDKGPDNNKFLRLWDEDYGQYRLKLGFSTMPTRNGDSQIITEYGTNRKGVGPFGSKGDSRGITDERRGRWLKIQVRVRLASLYNNDGVIEMWVDGVKTISNRNLPLYPQGGAGNYLRNGYLMGWANSGFDESSVTFIDDFTISAVPID